MITLGFLGRVQQACVVTCLLLLTTPVWAVTLRVQTAAGDSTFFAPVGDTVSVSVFVDSGAQALTGVELFLQYDPRLFALVDTTESARLLGRVLADTAYAVSDSVALVHYAEADLVGKPASGRLFAIRLRVEGGFSGTSDIGLADRALRSSLYTVPSREADTFVFEQVASLVYADRPPELLLPWRFEVLEDSVLVVDLRPLAQDAESDAASLIWRVASTDSLVGIVFVDALTVGLHPAPDIWGDLSLLVSVSDPSGGIAEKQMTLRVWPVNDAPVIAVGALPDSVQLTERNAVIELSGAATDIDGGDLIWTGVGTPPVGVVVEDNALARISAPLDWTGATVVVLEVVDGEGARAVHAVTVVRTQALNVLPGDFDGDGRVAFPDFLAFVQAFGSSNPSSEADLDGDGRVDFADFLIFAQNYGRTSE